MPAERRADAVRFALLKDSGDSITLHYVYEREHAPVAHGQLQYDCSRQSWLGALEDGCVQRQAECYVAGYLERRPRKAAASVG
jgi:hypothetical protein